MIRICLKLTGLVLIVAGTSGYGGRLAADYRRRLQRLEQLRQMIFLLKGQILYANAPLKEAFEAVGERSAGELSELFLRTAARIGEQRGETFYELWQEEVEAMRAETALTEDDRRSLKAMGEHLGYLDREMQERNLLLFLEGLDRTLEELRLHKQERCRLYISLGVMAGLFLAVLLL